MKLNVFISSQKDGIMSNEKKFFPTLSLAERNLLYENTLKRFFAKKNIDSEKVIILPNKNKEIKSRVVTPSIKKVKEAILLLKDSSNGLCVAAEMDDYPVIIASAQTETGHSVVAIAIGTLENLNNNLLHEIVESLIKETNAAPFEMTFYISACPNKDKLEVAPSLLTNNYIWKDTTIKRKKKTFLDIRYAIFNTLIKEIVDPNNIYFDNTDSTTNNKYFSNLGNKPGKNLVCVVYNEEEI